MQLTPATTTLPALRALVDEGREVTIYRRNDRGTVLAVQRAVLHHASGPYGREGWAVCYQATNGDCSWLALPPDWTWRITTTD
jgi:hypothetical protein